MKSSYKNGIIIFIINCNVKSKVAMTANIERLVRNFHSAIILFIFLIHYKCDLKCICEFAFPSTDATSISKQLTTVQQNPILNNQSNCVVKFLANEVLCLWLKFIRLHRLIQMWFETILQAFFFVETSVSI